MTYSVWMQVPVPGQAKLPWSRIAGNLTEEQAKVYEATMLFKVRVMPDQPED